MEHPVCSPGQTDTPVVRPGGSFFYSAFGLRFRSDFPCPGLEVSLQDEFDVDVSIEAVPPAIGEPKVSGCRFEARPGKLLVKTKMIADILVTSGNRIRVFPKPGASPESIQLLLWGWALAALLQQRDTLVLHGSVIKNGPGASVFAGPSGSGKSTLAMALACRGYAFLDDNLAAVSLEGTVPTVSSGIPEIKLLEGEVPQAVRDRMRPQKLLPWKDKVAVNGKPFARTESLPLETIFLFRPSEVLEIRPLIGLEKLKALEQNLFCPQFLEGLGKKGFAISKLFDVAQHARVFLIEQPRSRLFPNQTIERLESMSLLVSSTSEIDRSAE